MLYTLLLKLKLIRSKYNLNKPHQDQCEHGLKDIKVCCG